MANFSSEKDGFTEVEGLESLEKFGADIGRVIGHTNQGTSVAGLFATAQKIIDALEIDITVDDHPHFLAGLVYGLKDRIKGALSNQAKREMRDIVKRAKGDSPVESYIKKKVNR